MTSLARARPARRLIGGPAGQGSARQPMGSGDSGGSVRGSGVLLNGFEGQEEGFKGLRDRDKGF